MTTYAEKLKDPRWQRRRLERLQLAEFKCEDCGDGTRTLHVHHRRYVKGRQPWEYSDAELEVLCAECHAAEHEVHESFDWYVLEAGGVRGVVSLVHGYAWIEGPEEMRGYPHPESDRLYWLGALARVICDEPDAAEPALMALRDALAPCYRGIVDRILKRLKEGEKGGESDAK